jgi:hypothetical protein
LVKFNAEVETSSRITQKTETQLKEREAQREKNYAERVQIEKKLDDFKEKLLKEQLENYSLSHKRQQLA